MKDKNGLNILAIFLIGGIVFRYGVDVLDIASQFIGNMFAYKNSKVASKIEDIKIDTHKKWAVTEIEFLTNSDELINNIIGFDGVDFNEDYDDYDEE